MKMINNFSYFLGIVFLLLLNPPSLKAQGENTEITSPVALHPAIKVEHVMEVGPQAVRILYKPNSGDFYYTTFDGDVFQIKDIGGGKPAYEKIFSAQDHGITRLQGAAFLGNTLFLAGNISVNDNKGTKGRMVRYELAPSGNHKMTEVFNTVEIGSTKTTFDHGFNGVAISPDGKYIYVNSGARTDHGEVQDNGGDYPNSRDEALTARIFRFPIDAQDLLLPNDEEKLRADGYLYVKGIRNVYDLAFDPEGQLFAVSNSGDYDHPEDMFWIREGHHYGFPWVMGGIENPQQYPDWNPDPDTDPFISKFAHAWLVKYFRNDPAFPQRPEGVTFTPSVQNIGPDANEYRDRATGIVMDGDTTGATVGTFNAHSSPLGLFFDTEKILSDEFKGDGFVIRYAGGRRRGSTRPPNPLRAQGKDLLHLELKYDKAADNYIVTTTQIVEGFKEPTDAVMVGNNVYIIEYGGQGGNLWKITLPADTKQSRSNQEKSKASH
jgi:glucose/arabinose dehydrogenase